MKYRSSKWMMLSKMGISFFKMTPLSESTRLSGLLSCFLSALHFQSWTMGTKAKKRQKTQPLLHFTIILICKKKKEKVNDFREIIKITKKLNIKTLKTWTLFLNNYSWIYLLRFWDKRWITMEHPFCRTISSECLY